MTLTRTQKIGLAGALGGLVALGVAFGAQDFLQLIPCPLCLRERWPYRVAIALGLVVLVLRGRAARLACWLLLLTYLAGAGIAFVHVGVEEKWWPSPLPECNAPDLRGLSPAERFARMPLLPGKSCEDKDYPIPAIPITMTQANLAYALVIAGGMAMLLAKPVRRRR